MNGKCLKYEKINVESGHLMNGKMNVECLKNEKMNGECGHLKYE